MRSNVKTTARGKGSDRTVRVIIAGMNVCRLKRLTKAFGKNVKWLLFRLGSYRMPSVCPMYNYDPLTLFDSFTIMGTSDGEKLD